MDYQDILYTFQVWTNYLVTMGDNILTTGFYMAAGLAFFATIEFIILSDR